MANSLKSADRVELRCLWAPWPRFGLDLSPLDNYDIIGAVALFGRHGVTWGDLAVTAKSPQVVCHLSDGTKKDKSVLDDTVSIYLRITWQAVTTFLACAY